MEVHVRAIHMLQGVSEHFFRDIDGMNFSETLGELLCNAAGTAPDLDTAFLIEAVPDPGAVKIRPIRVAESEEFLVGPRVGAPAVTIRDCGHSEEGIAFSPGSPFYVGCRGLYFHNQSNLRFHSPSPFLDGRLQD